MFQKSCYNLYLGDIYMDKNKLVELANAFIRDTELNYVGANVAMRSDLVGLRIHDEPLVGFASADDSYLLSLEHNDEANLDMNPPTYWLPDAKTVVSIFLPYTEKIRTSNIGAVEASQEWLHGRIEGGFASGALIEYLSEALKSEGYQVVIPGKDERFWVLDKSDPPKRSYTSNWSERHVAYAAGLGTFCLSRGLITKKGTAGRFVSLVTSFESIPDERPYTGLTEYCIICGRCLANCPASAITIDNGKDHIPCAKLLGISRKAHAPYYGCGKCAVGVPCESARP
jgi:epoxyqueuosine reductase QueG